MAGTHDQLYDAGFYVKQGGGEVHLGNQVLGPDGTGAALVVGKNSLVAAIDITFSPAAGGGGSNICNVTIQLQDGLGNALSNAVAVDVWLSDAASGQGLTATTPSGGITPTTGTQLGVETTSKALRVLSNATGKIVLQITDTAKTGFYVACVNSFNQPYVSAQLVTGNYG